MNDKTVSTDHLLSILKEREKELNCLYQVDDVLANNQLTIPEMFEHILRILPSGWRFPEFCQVKIVYNNNSYQSSGFISSPISVECIIKADGKTIGSIEVVYTSNVPATDEGYFLDKEHALIKAVADRIGQMITYRRMKSIMNEWSDIRAQQHTNGNESNNWAVILDFIRHSDHSMLTHICRKLTNHLLINGVSEAVNIFTSSLEKNFEDSGYVNFPITKEPAQDIMTVSDRLFSIAEKNLGAYETTVLVKQWIQEENTYSLTKAIGSNSPSLRNIIEEIRKLQAVIREGDLNYSPKQRWLNVGLINRFLSDKPDFINVAKEFISFKDYFDIISRIIFPINSQGRLGGKSTGLFLARKILESECNDAAQLCSVKFPKTWYITTDTITEFLQYNNLEELNEQKYKDLQEIRIEYPNIIQLIKNSTLPPEIVRSLSVALDDLGDEPLIVRSSSTLEDRAGSSFSGKYKSLFLANQGPKKVRLEALIDAVLEVYASIFSPDPIQYRAQRGLLDIHEEMGILLQEVVGSRVGKYYFPLYSGVAFSNNEFRWSPRLNHEDGLVRIVPGLGTRAVDRLSDDFPVLISPGQPGIRVSIVPDEIKKYSPKKMDVIDLEDGIFCTIEIEELFREYGDQIEHIERIVSVMDYDHIKSSNKFELDFKNDDLVVTFDGVFSRTKFIRQIGSIMKLLREKMGQPVDVEFASDGNDLYLLQCRPQSYNTENVPASIPLDIPDRDIVFSGNRYISNGLIQNISHIVYIDADGYSTLKSVEDMRQVGRIVGMLNSILPKRQFILMGPGRWGSRGDIRLGVSVTYSDICNTSALVEIAVKKSGYLPELSFGTHFFQDLVEANIRVLPLYPDDEGVIFNERFLSKSHNILAEIYPEFERFDNVIRVISVPSCSDGKMLNIAMNADLGKALGYLSSHAIELPKEIKALRYDDYHSDGNSWRWRFHMAEQLASELDARLMGVKALYLFGSTNNGTAGPGSDIDLLIHFSGTQKQKVDLQLWLNGWSICLAEMNYMKTGYKMSEMLDVHFISDDDIHEKSSFALKIDDISDPAHLLTLKQQKSLESTTEQ